MSKLKAFASLGLAVAMGATIGLSACGNGGKPLPNYQGEDKDANGNTVYNTSLFYNNALKQGYPDPQVLDDTERSGYYYLYGTSDFQVMRSKNLAVWEPVRIVLDRAQTEEVKNCLSSNNWAPEVIYDDDTKLYYMYFSASPDAGRDSSDTSKKGVATFMQYKSFQMYVATSSSPTGPFKVVNFKDETSCGAGNIHTYNTTAEKEITQEQAESGQYAYIADAASGKYYEASFPQYWAKYCLFQPDQLSKLIQKNGLGLNGGASIQTYDAGYYATIDPSPFVDPVTGKKYLYFKAEGSLGMDWNISVGVEMENWLKPKWETAQYVAVDHFKTVADWKNGENKGVSYEMSDYTCNEGQFMLHHRDESGKDWYYLTFSVNDYAKRDYQVGMAVGDNPLGPFRKLEEYEGGLLLSANNIDSGTVSGAGHHSFVKVGDQLYIAYHRHRNALEPSADRYTAIDEVKFITVEDKNGEDMVIPYVNGPTDTVQPLPDLYSGYTNVASKATVSCTDASTEAGCVNDGLLSVYKLADEDFTNYIRESYITKTSTFSFDFANETEVRAVMVYNSALVRTMFYNISRMEFVLADGTTRVIENVKFDVEQYCEIGGQNNNTVRDIKSGAAALAEFNGIKVKSVKITVEVPEGQDEVGISEIKILGKA